MKILILKIKFEWKYWRFFFNHKYCPDGKFAYNPSNGRIVHYPQETGNRFYCVKYKPKHYHHKHPYFEAISWKALKKIRKK